MSAQRKTNETLLTTMKELVRNSQFLPSRSPSPPPSPSPSPSPSLPPSPSPSPSPSPPSGKWELCGGGDGSSESDARYVARGKEKV